MSQTKQIWLQNLSKIALIYKGEWTLSYTNEEGGHSEKVKIDKDGKYYANDTYRFDLLVLITDEKNIKLKKITLDREDYSTEDLIIDNENLITGTDNLGFKLEYRKI